METYAKGDAEFKLSEDKKELGYKLTVQGLADASAAHIHEGKPGAGGPPLVTLFGGPKKEGAFDGVLGEGTITDKNLVGSLAGKTVGDLVKLIESGDAYVNVHTKAHPGGELRGQIN